MPSFIFNTEIMIEMTESEITTTLTVQNKMGIHARPAAMIVRISNKYPNTEVWVEKDGEQTRLFSAGDKIHEHDLTELAEFGVKEISLIDFEAEGSLNSHIIINCFEKESVKYTAKDGEFGEMTKNDDRRGADGRLQCADAGRADYF